MNINRDIKEKFSTFFNVEERPGTLKIKNLQIRLKLANNFNTIFQSCPDGKAEYFAQSFVKKLQTKEKSIEGKKRPKDSGEAQPTSLDSC